MPELTLQSYRLSFRGQVSHIAATSTPVEQPSDLNVCPVNSNSVFAKCDFILPKSPISTIAQVYYGGFSLDHCLNQMELFKWDIGVYCLKSQFCGFGIDLTMKYTNQISNEFAPLLEVCHILADEKKNTCDQVKKLLYSSGVLRVAEKNCLSDGFLYCEEQHFTSCEDIEGGSVCKVCLQGATPVDETDEEQKHCRDIDECAEGVCGNYAESCDNSDLSYHCTCLSGYRFNGVYGSQCGDIDECAENDDICGVYTNDEGDTNAKRGTCHNNMGSFTCECGPGFFFDINMNPPCVDYDQCWDNPDRCVHGKCTNTIPFYTCDCDQGSNQVDIQPFGQKCEDIDECENSNPCGSNGTCSNSVFPFQCNCIDGFEQQPQTSTGLYGFICGDIDECGSGLIQGSCGTHDEVTCTNSIGGYECSCQTGLYFLKSLKQCLSSSNIDDQD
ncbi:uncharacterized protein LOC142348315 isoform X2 [Convolutriloba macropyga]|uniref:uncharacterized protein LOC142348315 isoform X2 n=1 Tax=Convolutriloba macropyga TaxID=536237 RepID=UPI003F524C66